MPFPLHFPCTNPLLSQMQLQPGEMLFVLGANGVGKSSLMHLFTNQNRPNVRKISAHRQTWMSSDALDMTPANKAQIEKHIMNEELQLHSRYKDQYAAQRASMTIYEMIDAENIRARNIAAEVDAGRMAEAKDKAKSEAPIKVINELLRLSNIPIEISLHANERLMASKCGGPLYSAAELSDGERNALLIAGSVLTAPSGTLIIIDEPERHLHRSIISPLLSQLFERRRDCAFVVSTHDHDLPLENPAAQTLLIRSCNFQGATVQNWEADQLAGNMPLDDILKRDLLGARRKILFVEGTEKSLDKPLYSLIFPQVSVIPKGSCRDVEFAVQGVSAGEQLHWLKAFGIVDSDGYDAATIMAKVEKGIYAVPYYSVEAIYFHPSVIEMVARVQAGVSGDDVDKLLSAALMAGIAEVRAHAIRLCEKAVKKAVAKAIAYQLPDGDQYLHGI
jgi:ATPase subunit of ABC transporter with duplicated ATPase domains